MTSTQARKRYGVVGNPIAQSRSPFIHREFGLRTGIALSYEKILAPLDGFTQTVHEFFEQGGAGLNVTVPFKEQACLLPPEKLSEPPPLPGAGNTHVMQAAPLQ